MQGKKLFAQKLFYQISLDDLVSSGHFYRRLDDVLDLQFLYRSTRKYYGSQGQKSLDPVVFFKICLIGYLENIVSDRKLIDLCSDSLAIRLFMGFNLDEQLPWHSTISRTRQLYEADLFDQVFRKILSQCIDTGLVGGHTQAIDSAFVKANASMDTLELKVPEKQLDDHLRKVHHMSQMDKDGPHRKAQKKQGYQGAAIH
jgi:transposase